MTEINRVAKPKRLVYAFTELRCTFGGRSRGLGVVKLEIDKMCWFDYPEDRPQFLLDYLKKLVTNDDSAYKDANEYKDHWIQQLIKHLQNKSNSQEGKNVV